MRILIDLQGKQNLSRDRGIGRYSLALTRAIARNAGKHQIYVLLNGLFPDSLHELRAALADLIPESNTLVFSAHGPVDELLVDNSWRVAAAQIVREQAINDLEPDFVLICSLFDGAADNTISSVGILQSDVSVAVILYDLIPFLDPDKYIGWPPARKWYFGKIDSLKRAQLLLGISQSAAREAIEYLGVKEERVVTISSAVDPNFKKLSLPPSEEVLFLRRLHISRKFLMHTSAFEQRKNFEGLIKAFAALPKRIRNDYQLVLVCKLSESDRDALKDVAGTAGLGHDELILTGFMSDSDLIQLYSLCHLFVFPSFHEGFGLPALEAMCCGAAVIGSNSSSIPEVIGRSDAVFDPGSTESMSAAIFRVLTDEAFHASLKEHSVVQAKKFDWNKSAVVAIKAMEKVHKDRDTPNSLHKSKRHKLSSTFRQITSIRSDAAPVTNDLIETARALYQNELAVNRLKASANFGGKLTWRVEGPFDSTYSLALLNRETARALAALGHQVVLHSTEGPGDFPANPSFLVSNPDLAEMHSRVAHFPHESVDVVSRILYPPRVSDMASNMNMLHHYAWEESGFPQEWVSHFNSHLHGMTCLSDHVKKIMIDNGVTVPLTTSGCGVDHWERTVASTDFNLQAKKFRFLHVSSCFPRKGADSLLEAFGKSFSKDDDVSLVVKTFPNPHNEIHLWLAQCKQKFSAFPDVLIIEDDLTDEQLKALYQQCDVLVAPSRAEGFGVPMAEAMLSGLPVITTNWSGQLDFCNAQTAWLVDYTFAPAKSHFGLFFSAWAEPDIADMAQKLKIAFQSTAEQRKSMVNAGRRLLESEFNWLDCVSRAVNAARAWRDSPPVRPIPRIGWITTWNTKCGIATYSEHLISNMPCEVSIFAPHHDKIVAQDSPNCYRTWSVGKDTDHPNNFERVSSRIRQQSLNTVVIQFNYGFYNFSELAEFIDKQVAEGRVVIMMMHSTSDPSSLYNWQLSELREGLTKCHRILVHSIPDLNRLKVLGHVDNVCLFPHGVLDFKPQSQTQSVRAETSLPLVGAYGFCLPHKGLAELIEAAAILKQRGCPIRLRLVNAQYPDPVSAKLAAKLKKLILALSLGNLIEFHDEFLDDADSLRLLSDAALLVFPYQVTGESSSAAVRYGLATNCPVAVTPLGIFDDIGDAAFQFAGISPTNIADGITEFLDDISSNTERAQAVRTIADRWRTAHDYAVVGTRLHNLCIALLNENEAQARTFSASSREFTTGVGVIRGRSVATTGKSGYLLFGPYAKLTSGRYLVRIKGRVSQLGSPAAFADIAIEGGSRVLASYPLLEAAARGILFEAEILLESVVKGLEIRIHVSADSELVINRLEILAEGDFNWPDATLTIDQDSDVRTTALA